MRVQVRYFAADRDAVGQASETLDLPAGSRLEDLLRRLESLHPDLARHRARLRYAVGERFAGPEEPLAEGHDVALLPPVSGG